jgi:pimeloyl-ACP methyl ester carboxylesterase
MFQPLLTRLPVSFHLVAPDYPGFGHSDWPDPKQFDYTFDHIAAVMNDFTQVLGLSYYAPYMQDYGGPVGFRMALAHPERVQALIGVSHSACQSPRPRSCSCGMATSIVETRPGARAAHARITAHATGFCFCGIVDEPPLPSLVGSAASATSACIRNEMSFANLPRVPTRSAST